MLYGLIMLPAAVFVFLLVPETKSKSLEEIELYWSKRTHEIDAGNQTNKNPEME